MRIFVSSTSEDLKLHREAVTSSLRTLQHYADDMIYWGSDNRPPLEVATSAIRDADVLLIILAHRYGSSPTGSDKSYVELEFQTALQLNIPVLAFVIDESHPWPPNHVDVDLTARTALGALKSTVAARCTRTTFTTPESLAISVTQAVANLQRRTSAPQQPTPSRRHRVALAPRSSLRASPDTIIPLTRDVDGSQLALRVTRSSDLDQALRHIAHSTGVDINKSPLVEVRTVLHEAGMKKWCRTNLHQVQLPNGSEVCCYITRKTLAELFAPSLLTRLLPLPQGARNPIQRQNLQRWESSEASMPLVTQYQHQSTADYESIGGNNRFLAVPVSSPDLYAVGWPDHGRPGAGHPVYWRQFIPESLYALDDVRYDITAMLGGAGESFAAGSGPISQFGGSIAKLLIGPRGDSVNRVVVRFDVPRRSLCRLIIGVAKAIVAQYADGRCHGDLKPQNVLISSAGPHVIDGLGLREGKTAPLISPGWAAPEQVTVEAVSSATDVYPLTLMTCSALGALLSGEVASHLLPGGDGEPQRIDVIRDPRAYLLMDSKVLPRNTGAEWFKFLQHGLMFQSRKRIRSPRVFSKGLEKLVQSNPPHGSVTINISATIQVARLLNGNELVCNVLDDDQERAYFADRPPGIPSPPAAWR